MVSNSPDAVRSFVAAQDLAVYIGAVVARTEHDTMAARRFSQDIKAGHAAGIAVIAFVNRTRKHDQLSAAGPRTIVSELADITRALTV